MFSECKFIIAIIIYFNDSIIFSKTFFLIKKIKSRTSYLKKYIHINGLMHALFMYFNLNNQTLHINNLFIVSDK